MEVADLVALVWTDADPAEGSSVWWDPESGFKTRDRLQAIAWVQANRKSLRHGWELP